MNTKLSETDKIKIQDYFNPLVESFKKEYILKKPHIRIVKTPIYWGFFYR